MFKKVDQLFFDAFKEKPSRHFVSNGRLEILGNHTDHQHGLCLVATCSLGILASVKEEKDKVLIESEGYSPFSFSLFDLKKKDEEKGTSLALAKGVLFYLVNHGYQIGGFKMACSSNIFAGAGVSSSAAFELLIGEIMNGLYNKDKIDRLTLAKAGQFAENVYFGKASGLLDQCGSSFGGLCFLDFKDLNNVVVKPIAFPSSWKVKIFLINPGLSHEKLTGVYESIPFDMKKVAREVFNKDYLREVDPLSFYEKIYKEKNVSPLEKGRALHFFGEEERVLRAYEAIKEENLNALLELERETELSQETLLQNVMISNQYEGSPLEAVHRAEIYLKRGSARVMGGGFAGSIICFVPFDEVTSFLEGMAKFYPLNNIKEVSIPSIGAHEEKI